MIPASASPSAPPAQQEFLPKPGLQDDRWIAALKDCDENAIPALHECFSAPLYGIIRRIVQDNEGAENVLKLTFENAAQSIDQYDPKKSRLFTWMVAHARQLAALELLQQEQKQSAAHEKNAAQGTVTLKVVYSAGETHDKEGLPKLADSMEPRYRMMLNLIYFQGFSVGEIAERFSLPIQEVKLRLAIAIRQLRSGCTE